jgi:intracellular multiplication protein IcmO
MPLKIRTSINAYLTSLPGFQPDKGPKQSQTTLDQHGFLQMQFTKILGSLADVYGHVFLTPHGEVDMNDVVLNRRILVVMLPALEKSADEVANLGKIIVATLKGMMGSTLGSTLESDWDTAVDARPYASPSPFIVILDEVGYYCVTGMAIMAAQGRSLGFSLVFATQDIPAMMRENDKEAKSIIANTTTKIVMRVEELEQTAKLAIDSGGKGMKAQVGGFSGKSGELQTSYLDNMEARLEMVDRISSLDLRALGVGEAFVIWHDKYFKTKTFHAFQEGEYDNLPRLELRVNHFIPVARPNPQDVKREESLPLIAEKLADARFAQIIEARAKEERGKIEQAAAAKRDPAKMRSEIACAATAFLRANKKTGPQGDYLTASCAAIAAVTMAQVNDANVFARDVRRVEGLPEAPHARSGRARMPDQPQGVIGRRAPTEAGAIVRGPGRPERPFARPMPPPLEDLPPPPDDDLDFETEPDLEDEGFDDSFGRPVVPTAPARIEAQRSDAPSTMRRVEHGVTVDGRDTFKMAEKLQTNDATLRFLAAHNFDAEPGAEPGVEVIDTAIEKAVILDDEEDDAPPPPAMTADPVEIERADVASAKATQWTERATNPSPAKSRAPVQDLETAVRSGDAQNMTASYLAELLKDD